MMATPHALIGVALVVGTRRFVLGAVLAVAAHLVVDIAPSWEPWFLTPEQGALVLADGMLMCTLVWGACQECTGRMRLLVLTGAVFGIVPDLLHFVWMTGAGWWWLEAFERVHQGIQHPAPRVASLAAQYGVVWVMWEYVSRRVRRDAKEGAAR